ncbi:BMP family ABC transporter substrate-binding protein [Vibrio sp. 404]|uniref:BMP family ABC transporter substrate-binding protein n=1 Tax=Vibrio marinisediminis TaxID=2758441 RepID=A0A7W2FTL7_9VIBR|nr:BMP family ABC transporter substrate-binding protein [Vibrio marinisediminis]MBA5764026.1 BMP family ABC transporter substrate-binding protein [Vibrio marinisediminis]
MNSVGLQYKDRNSSNSVFSKYRSLTTALLCTLVSTSTFATEAEIKPIVLFQSEIHQGSYLYLVDKGTRRFEQTTSIPVTRKIIDKSNGLYIQELINAAKEGYSPIVVIESNSMDTFADVARTYPSIRFISLDVSYHVPNILGLTFNHAEGAYIIGYLAGLKTKSNKVGFIGGKNIPTINNFKCGYELGLKDSNPTAVLNTDYINKGPRSWDDVDSAKAISQKMLDENVDVIFPVAGYASLGVMEAVKNDGDSFSFGVDQDYSMQFPSSTLASLEKKVDVAVFAALMQLKNGIWNGNRKHFGIKQGVINVAINSHNPSVSTSDKTLIDKLILELKGKNNAISQKINLSCSSTQ